MTVVLIGVTLLAVIMVVYLIGICAESSSWLADSFKTFNQRWPAISEDEFVAKCGPGTDRDKALRVRVIISEQLGVDYDRIHPEQNFVQDLGCD